VSWSKPSVIKGTPPIGEVEARCAGCRRRFVAGESYVRRNVPPFGQMLYAHPGCAETAWPSRPPDHSREENPNP
jgi:hypothetical protein